MTERLVDTATADTATTFSRAWREHSRVMMLVSIGVVVAARWPFPAVSPVVQAIVLAVAVAVLGVPHGALDHVVARQCLPPRPGRAWLPVFLVAYLAAAAIVLFSWRFAGVATLLAFLAASAWHFGSGDVVRSRYSGGEWATLVLWRGLTVIGLPVALHGDETTRIFAALVPDIAPESLGAASRAVTPFLFVLLAALALASLAISVRAVSDPQRRQRLVDGLEGVVIAVLFCVAQPLMAFVVYFCGWHSPRHVLTLVSGLGHGDMRAGARAFLVQSLPLTGATLLLSALAWPSVSAAGAAIPDSPARVEPGLLRLVFHGLSALTFPHMIVVALSERRRERGDSSP